MNPRFVLVSSWQLESPREAVWRLLDAVQDWPSWWPHLERVERLGRGATEDGGMRHSFRWRSGFGYGFSIVMTTTRAERPRELEGRADGDLRGTGLWVLDEAGPGATRLAYRWDVELVKPWMRLLAPLLRPLFARRHFAVMDAGACGMAGRLGCRVSRLGEWSGFPSAIVRPRAA